MLPRAFWLPDVRSAWEEEQCFRNRRRFGGSANTRRLVSLQGRKQARAISPEQGYLDPVHRLCRPSSDVIGV